MTNASPETRIGPNEILRFFLELFAFLSLGIWGFLAFEEWWLKFVVGLGAPLVAILVWALFRSPKAVFRIDAFAKAIIEIAVFTAAALAWWTLGQPIVAVVFAVVAAVSGVINGRRELAAG
ncbi:YrdB family protein [Agromyces atrinae]|uniref:YrdB family protein n=1 Tax=Agromyces atrinae TaxID=592376 RepID=UPI001F594A1B|nr:YrdB family protein [Agromyces atrinae]MCI2957910.1 YrdB family protein [Agromyces atrinae]